MTRIDRLLNIAEDNQEAAPGVKGTTRNFGGIAAIPSPTVSATRKALPEPDETLVTRVARVGRAFEASQILRGKAAFRAAIASPKEADTA